VVLVFKRSASTSSATNGAQILILRGQCGLRAARGISCISEALRTKRES